MNLCDFLTPPPPDSPFAYVWAAATVIMAGLIVWLIVEARRRP